MASFHLSYIVYIIPHRSSFIHSSIRLKQCSLSSSGLVPWSFSLSYSQLSWPTISLLDVILLSLRIQIHLQLDQCSEHQVWIVRYVIPQTRINHTFPRAPANRSGRMYSQHSLVLQRHLSAMFLFKRYTLPTEPCTRK